MVNVKKTKQKSWEILSQQIKEQQKDPEFIRAAYEFIRHHTSHHHVYQKVKL